MNPTYPAALVLVVLAATWVLGRRRPRAFLRSTDTADVVALNRAQIERQRERSRPSPPRLPAGAVADDVPVLVVQPAGIGLSPQPRLRRERLQQLQAWLSGTRQQRLEAIRIASGGADRRVLPLLRRALRDPHPEVMAAAAAAIARYRGRTTAVASGAAMRSRRLLVQPDAGRAPSRPRRV